MAIYSTDFSTGTAGSLPSGWTVEYAGEANASHVIYVNPDTGKKEFRLYHEIGGGGFPTNISYSSAGSSSNSEILALIATPLDSGVLRLLMRYAPGGPSYYSATMWNLTTQENINISIQEVNSGAYSNLASSTSTGIPIGTTSWIRARVDGTTVSYKAWAYGTPEPSAWVSRTDSTLTSGNVGIEYVKRTGETMDIRIQYFAAATAGETAPFPASVEADKSNTGKIYVQGPIDSTGGGSQMGGWGTFGLGALFGGEASQAGETVHNQDQAGKLRVQAIVDSTQTGKLRVQANNSQDQTGKLRVQIHSTKDQTGQFRIASEPTRPIQGALRIQQTYDTPQTGKLRVAIEQTQDQNGILRVSQLSNRDQTGKLRIMGHPERDQTGKLRVQAVLDQTQTGRLRVQAILDRPQTGVLNIIEFYPQEQSGSVSINNPVITQGGYIPQWAPVGEIDEAEISESGTVIPKFASEGTFEQPTDIDVGMYVPKTIEKGNL